MPRDNAAKIAALVCGTMTSRAPKPATLAQMQAAERIDLDALFVWSAIHRLAGAINSEAIAKPDLQSGVLDQATAHIMHKVGQVLAD